METKQELFCNVLTFDWPTESITLYFSKTDFPNAQRIKHYLVTDDVVKHFTENDEVPEFLYTTFTEPTAGFEPLSCNLDKVTASFVKKYLIWKIKKHFENERKTPTKHGFINECQVWVQSTKEVDDTFDIFYKFSLKIQLREVSNQPELLISFDGKSKVFKQNAVELTEAIGSDIFSWVLYENKLCKWSWLNEESYGYVDFKQVFPVLNKNIRIALELPFPTPPRDNKYKRYLHLIQKFHEAFTSKPIFKEVIPINCEAFIQVPKSKILKTSFKSNELLFGGKSLGYVPKFDLKKYKPFEPSRLSNTTLFFVVHQDDVETAKELHKQFQSGFSWFKGLYDYVELRLHIQSGLSIVFKNKDNPIPEIENQLRNRDFTPGVTYIAVYLTPISKFDNDKAKRECYYKVKELLLKREITSQVIDPAKMKEQGKNWVYSLPNIAIAMLAKLQGKPWRLNTPIKNELIVGVGAFLHKEENIQYIGSSFSFTNDGQFNQFEYFQKDELDVLAGSIAESVKQYATMNDLPHRLIIHFYKTMSERELRPILEELEALDLNIPVFIVSINKTESNHIVAFDKKSEDLMPISGTIVNIGTNKYLLFNNTRYNNSTPNKMDGYPFPIKLKIQCSDKEQLRDIAVMRELIDQVYQFSRMYWKSLRQQNLPVTIKYPEMVAQIAPHFSDSDIPEYGKSNLWFL